MCIFFSWYVVEAAKEIECASKLKTDSRIFHLDEPPAIRKRYGLQPGTPRAQVNRKMKY
jgi:hypothetical protein